MTEAYWNLQPNGLFATPATNPDGGRATTVGEHVAPYLSPANPWLQQAQTKAKQAANQRGLLNSSMAVQAGTEGSLQTAAQMASQDAQATATRGLAAQQNQYTLGQNREKFGQQLQLDSAQTQNQAHLASQQFQFNKDLSQQQYGQQLGLAGKQHEFNKDLSQQQYGQQLGLAGKQHEYALDLGEQQYTQQLGLASQQHGYALDLGNQQFSSQRVLNADQAAAALQLDNQGYTHQLGLADVNNKYALQQGEERFHQQQALDTQQQNITREIEQTKLNSAWQSDQDKLAADRQNNMAVALRNFATDWNQAYAQINSNTNLSEESRNAMYTTINDIMKRNVNAIKGMYGVNLSW
ncbi:MAG: hypothetical protein HQL63_02430 [Magnetococcales bacterium]|nr:hypothetical protein [Magnetococcales bacterium]MBF0321391.1 hypothetical protein [Magnetococcales bacterium]